MTMVENGGDLVERHNPKNAITFIEAQDSYYTNPPHIGTTGTKDASVAASVFGAGMNAQRTEMYSEFSAVRKVKLCPRRHLIKVNGLLSRNRVFAADEDFAFVRDHIISHCSGLKNKEE